MRRIKLLVYTVCAVMVVGLSTSLSAQNSTDAQAYAQNPNNPDLVNAGIDVGSVNATLEEALTYAKDNYYNVKQGQTPGYTPEEKDIAILYYRELALYLEDGSHKSPTQVASGIVYAYVKTKVIIQQESGHSFERSSGQSPASNKIQFLLDLVEETVNNLQ